MRNLKHLLITVALGLLIYTAYLLGQSGAEQASLFNLSTIAAAPSLTNSNTSHEAFRQTLLTYADWLKAEGLQQRIRDLTDEEFAILYNAFPDHESFVDTVNMLTSTSIVDNSEISPNAAQKMDALSQDSIVPFTPAYPSGLDYDELLNRLPVGFLVNGPANRCDSNMEAAQLNAHATLRTAAVVAQTTCEITPFPLAIVACAASGVANELVVNSQDVIDACVLQDSLIDGAEIEATYENSLQIIDQLNSHVDLAIQYVPIIQKEN